MAVRDLLFNILARDKTGAAFTSVSRKLKGVEGAARTAGARIKDAAGGLSGLSAGAALATLGLSMSISEAIQGYDDMSRVAAKVEAAVKSTGGAAGFTADQLFDMADAIERSTRFDGDNVLDGVTAQLLTFDKVQGDVFKRAQMTALDMSTVLNTDVKGSAIMLGKALNDPVRGLTALRKVGVSFTEDQEDVIKALAETGQMAEAQGKILDAIGAQGFAGQAEAAAKAGIGPLIQLQHTFGTVTDEIGRVMSQLLLVVVPPIQAIVSAFGALPEPMRTFIVVAGLVGAAVVPLVAVFGLMVTAVGAVSAPVLAVVAGVVGLTAAVVALWPYITGLVDWIGGKLVEAFGWFKSAIQSVQADPLAFAQNLARLTIQFNPLVIAAKALWDMFKAVFPECANLVADMVVKVKEWLLDKLSGIFDSVKAKVAAVGDAFYDLWDRVVGHSYVPDLVDDVGREFDRLPGEMVDPAIAATDRTAGSFKDMAQDTVRSLLDMAADGELTFGSFLDTMLQSGMNWGDQIISNVFDRVAEAAGNALAGSAGNSGGFFGSMVSGIAGMLGAGSVPGLDTGGEAGVVGGRAGIDRNMVRLRLSEGERVQVTRRGQASGGSPITINIQTPNPAAFAASRAQIGAQLSRAVAAGQRGA